MLKNKEIAVGDRVEVEPVSLMSGVCSIVITEEEFDRGTKWYLEHGGEAKNLRDDIKCRDFAKLLGYTVIYGNNRGGALQFVKGNKTIWDTSNSKGCRWTCADLLDVYFRNHRTYPSLKEALEKEA